MKPRVPFLNKAGQIQLTTISGRESYEVSRDGAQNEKVKVSAAPFNTVTAGESFQSSPPPDPLNELANAIPVPPAAEVEITKRSASPRVSTANLANLESKAKLSASGKV